MKFQDNDKKMITELKRTLAILSKKEVYVPEYIFEIIEDVSIHPDLFSRTPFKSFSMLSTLNLFKKKYAKFERKVMKKFVLETRPAKAIHCMHETYDHCATSLQLATMMRIPLTITLQADPFERKMHTYEYLPKDYSKEIVPAISYMHVLNYINQRSNRLLFFQILHSGTIKSIFALSKAPFLNSGIDELAEKKGVHTEILHPGNACDVPRSNFKPTKKIQAIFFARAIPEKGIFEIPYIWQHVHNALPNATLHIFGHIPSRFNRKVFFKIIDKLNLSSTINCHGFADQFELESCLQDSKVFLYPSHFDCFSLSILESIANKTSVVTYDIPAASGSFNGLKCVHMVPEWDLSRMAKETIKVLRLNEDEYFNEHYNPIVCDYLNLHSSWSLVASSEISALKRALKLN